MAKQRSWFEGEKQRQGKVLLHQVREAKEDHQSINHWKTLVPTNVKKKPCETLMNGFDLPLKINWTFWAVTAAFFPVNVAVPVS